MISRPRRCTLWSWLVAASFLIPAVSTIGAQESGALRGRVTDSAGVPLAGALVELDETFWRTTTGPEGSFVLSVPPGTWLLRVRMLGFSPETLSVSAPLAAVVIRLRAAPFELRAISVTASQAPPLSNAITRETARQVPPLGEPDIFRSVVLLPGVSQPNDFKGRIHLAGGASDETGVSLDGHPLQEPFHLLGVLGAFNIAALDRADVLIHHVPVGKSGGLSGLIDLSSRRVAAKGETEILIGLLSTGVTAVRPRVPGGIDLLASVRTTYLDNLVERVGGQVRVHGDELTLLGYRDGLLRIGKTLGERTRAEALVFSTEDNRRTAGAAASGSRPFIWGETLWGVRIDHRGPDWIVTARTSFNRAHADKKRSPVTDFSNRDHIELRRDWTSAWLDVARVTERSSVHVGAGLDARQTRHQWEDPGGTNLVSPRAPRRFRGGESQTLPSLFAEVAHRNRGGVTLTGGIRASYLAGRTFPAPGFVIGKEIRPGLQLEGALERRHQFVAELEEPEEGTGNQPLFLLWAPRIADVAAVSLSSRARTGDGARAPRWNVTVFGKSYRDRTSLVGNPRAHMDSTGVVPDTFPHFARVPGKSYGLALTGTRTLGSRALVQTSYTFQRATDRMDGVESPVQWDAPHALSLFGSLGLGRKWILNAVFQAKSGAAATPVEARIFVPDRSLGGGLQSRYLPGQRYTGRLPSYRRLDLAVRREWRARNADWALSVQAVNLLYRRNVLAPNWSSYFCAQSRECGGASPSRTGLPLIPSLTFEVRW